MDFEFETTDQFLKPRVEIKPLTPRGRQYINDVRKIGDETIEAFKVGSDETGRIVLPCYEWSEEEYEKLELRDVKFRSADGSPAHSSGAKEICEKGASEYKSILFGTHLADPAAEAGTLFVTFGTYDAMAAYDSGIRNVVSLARGDGSYNAFIENQFEFLKEFKRIVFAPDVDPNTETAARSKENLIAIIERLGYGKALVVRKPEMRGCKDINELLIEHGREAVKQAFAKAAHAPDPSFEFLADGDDEELKDGLPFGFSEIDRATNGVVPGDLVLLAGNASVGKTTVALNITKTMIDNGQRVFLYSIEQGKMKIRTKLELMMAGPGNNYGELLERTGATRYRPKPEIVPFIREWYRKHVVRLKTKDHLRIGELLEKMQYAKDRFGCAVFIVDNLMTLTEGIPASEEYSVQSDIAAALKRFAEINQVSVILLVHHKDRDESKEPVMREIYGSSKTYGRADTVIQVYKVTPEIAEKRDDLVGVDGILLVNKVRDGGELTSARYVFCQNKSERIVLAKDRDDLFNPSGWEKLPGAKEAIEEASRTRITPKTYRDYASPVAPKTFEPEVEVEDPRYAFA